jgi:nucleotide sugar dehydrogenase
MDVNNIGIIGIGRLGICYAILFAKAGYKVFIYDINANILDNIKNDEYNYYEPNLNNLILIYKSNLILSYQLNDVLNNCDILFTFIQTPSLSNGLYNHEYIDNLVEDCIKYDNSNSNSNSNYKLLIINSTVIPEYCNSIKNKLLSNKFKLCYNPSFIAQGSIINNIINPDIILIGMDDNENNEIKNITNIYKNIINSKDTNIFKCMNLYEAEITKLSINCYITFKISYANLIGDMLNNNNCNPDIVLNAIGSDTRIGNKCLNYGFGYGGPCLPRDNKALYAYGNDKIDLHICKNIDNINNNHLMFQYNQMKNAEEPIIFKYITYKDTSDILDESQKLKLALLLANDNKKVIIYERQMIIDILKDKYNNLFEYITI